MLSLEGIKRHAAEIGFDLCGVAPCRHLEEDEQRFRAWLAQGCHASLGYLERHIEKRFDPRQLVEGARTAVVCAVNYRNRFSGIQSADQPAKIASYACARDYHDTLRSMLGELLARLRADVPELAGRAFVDTAPLSEKQLAVEAGLGWIGRQSLLVTPRYGTWVVLGELLLTEACDRYDTPLEGNGCGTCRRCVEECPTGALSDTRTVDTRRCISRHTVEREYGPRIDLHGWIFGCEACQSCCPYNRHTPGHALPAFDPLFDPTELDAEAWRTMSDETFAARFGTTPLARGGAERIRHNLSGTGRE